MGLGRAIKALGIPHPRKCRVEYALVLYGNGARGIFLRALGDQPILRSNLRNASALDIALAASGSEK
jgi:hypothetical protein